MGWTVRPRSNDANCQQTDTSSFCLDHVKSWYPFSDLLWHIPSSPCDFHIADWKRRKQNFRLDSGKWTGMILGTACDLLLPKAIRVYTNTHTHTHTYTHTNIYEAPISERENNRGVGHGERGVMYITKLLRSNDLCKYTGCVLFIRYSVLREVHNLSQSNFFTLVAI